MRLGAREAVDALFALCRTSQSKTASKGRRVGAGSPPAKNTVAACSMNSGNENDDDTYVLQFNSAERAVRVCEVDVLSG